MKFMPVKSHTVAGQLDDHIKTMRESGGCWRRETGFNRAYFQGKQV